MSVLSLAWLGESNWCRVCPTYSSIKLTVCQTYSSIKLTVCHIYSSIKLRVCHIYSIIKLSDTCFTPEQCVVENILHVTHDLRISK